MCERVEVGEEECEREGVSEGVQGSGSEGVGE